MRLPGFTAEASFCMMLGQYAMSSTTAPSTQRAAVVEMAFPLGGRFSTLPTCGNENCRTVVVWEPCGSPLPGFDTPMCPGGTTTECDYVCRFPSGRASRRL